MNDSSFMKTIDDFDNISESNKASDETREYAKAMRDIFIKIEEANILFHQTMNKITQKDDSLN